MGKETQEEQNNTQEQSHTQVGWSMHQSVHSIMSDDDTDRVSGYDDYYSDLDDNDSLPEAVVILFTEDINSIEIYTNDESSDEDDLLTLIPNHAYDSSNYGYSDEGDDYDSNFEEDDIT